MKGHCVKVKIVRFKNLLEVKKRENHNIENMYTVVVIVLNIEVLEFRALFSNTCVKKIKLDFVKGIVKV